MRHSSLTVRESERAGARVREGEVAGRPKLLSLKLFDCVARGGLGYYDFWAAELLSLKLPPCYNVTKIADL